jgi:hypothetical protein
MLCLFSWYLDNYNLLAKTVRERKLKKINFHCISVTVQITEKWRNCQRNKLHPLLILKESKIGITAVSWFSQDDSRLVPADHCGSVTCHFYDNLRYKGTFFPIIV